MLLKELFLFCQCFTLPQVPTNLLSHCLFVRLLSVDSFVRDKEKSLRILHHHLRSSKMVTTETKCAGILEEIERCCRIKTTLAFPEVHHDQNLDCHHVCEWCKFHHDFCLCWEGLPSNQSSSVKFLQNSWHLWNECDSGKQRKQPCCVSNKSR